MDIGAIAATAATDQAEAGLLSAWVLIAKYNRTLRRGGLGKMEAFVLTKDFAKMYWMKALYLDLVPCPWESES